MTELGIVEIREILRVIKEKYKYDFSNFALTSLKQRLEKTIIRNNLNGFQGLIKLITDNTQYFDTFLYELFVPSTEMFRDPSLWRWLRDELFTKLTEDKLNNYKIWLPNCISGGELYSIAILLFELGILDKVRIIASSVSEKSINNMKRGIYDLKKIEVSNENYTRSLGSRSLDVYYEIDRYFANRDISLIRNVEFHKQNLDYDDSPMNVKLILFRNSLIYYNPGLQEKILKKMYESLSASGHLIIGIKERIRDTTSFKGFDVVEESERVYKRKI